MRNRVVCVDIGSDSVKMVVGAKSVEGLELLAQTSVPVQGVTCGVVTDVEKCTQALKKAFANVKARQGDFIVVGLSNYYVESTKSSQSKYVPENKRITEDDLEELFEKAENAYLKEDLEKLDVCLQYYNVDEVRNTQNPVGMKGVKLEAEYRIFSCRKTLLGNIEQCVNDAGFEVYKFVFSPCYLADLIIPEEDKEAGILFVDLGADVTRVTIFVDKALYTSFAMPFGSRSLTMDIKNSYPVTLKQAENLKKQYGCALAELAEENAEVGFKSSDAWGERSLRVSDMAGVVQCRLDEIFRGIRYQLRKMALEDLIEMVIMIGGGVQQNSMKFYLEKNLSVPAQIAVINENAFNNLDSEISTCTFSNVLGMLYAELQESQIGTGETSAGFLEKLTGGFRNLFGSKNKGEDTQM